MQGPRCMGEVGEGLNYEGKGGGGGGRVKGLGLKG